MTDTRITQKQGGRSRRRAQWLSRRASYQRGWRDFSSLDGFQWLYVLKPKRANLISESWGVHSYSISKIQKEKFKMTKLSFKRTKNYEFDQRLLYFKQVAYKAGNYPNCVL